MEGHEARYRQQDEGEQQVDNPLGQDRTEGLGERDLRVVLQQVGTVGIAKFGRHDAVGKPGQKDDLGEAWDRRQTKA